MYHALYLPNILGTIFRFTDRKTDVSCVRVCRTWHEHALDALWCRINRLEGLFKLLGPMEEISPAATRVLVSLVATLQPIFTSKLINI